ncbi:hypothetical protein BaRGS_00015772 [Batillaria attramentaria]|uniref:Integron gene cassette protein n=1 Tax=Batillaria attramentaria TaxID=370345 RepID=A0ABD0L0V5_9CAEN
MGDVQAVEGSQVSTNHLHRWLWSGVKGQRIGRSLLAEDSPCHGSLFASDAGTRDRADVSWSQKPTCLHRGRRCLVFFAHLGQRLRSVCRSSLQSVD